MSRIIKNIFTFYYSGFKSMTWGRVLWVIIIIKLFVLFFILKLFFFKPYLQDKTPEEKQEAVGNELIYRSE